MTDPKHPSPSPAREGAAVSDERLSDIARQTTAECANDMLDYELHSIIAELQQRRRSPDLLASEERVAALIDALHACAACNDLSGVSDDHLLSEACNQLQGVEIIARDAIEKYEAGVLREDAKTAGAKHGDRT